MPSLKDRELNATLEPIAANTSGSVEKPGNRQQPVALEVPVTVNGARQLEGNDKREPFSESTKTVLVFDNGAVIRLGSAVAPSQLLFLTNDKTKKEVVCQVVKSKNYSNSSGYVEVQFTEPVSGFWGLRFPADQRTVSSGAHSAADAHGSAYSGGGMERNAPMVVAAEVETPSAAAERFKAEMKSEERGSNRVDLVPPIEPSIEKVKLEANRLQEQLSTMLFAEPQGASQEKTASAQGPSSKALSETTAKLFELAEASSIAATEPKPPQPESSAAHGKAVADALPAEELKVPSWLEPLARNAANPAPEEEKAIDTPVHVEPAAKSEKQEKTAKPQTRPMPAIESPVFGKTLLGQSASPASASSSASKKVLLATAIAAAILIAAAGGTWYLRQPSNPAPTTQVAPNPAPTQATGATSTPALPETAAANPDQVVSPVQGDATTLTNQTAQRNTPTGSPAVNAGSASAPNQAAIRPASISEKVSKPNPMGEAAGAADAVAPAGAADPEPKKPTLGKIRLGKPRVGRSRQANGIAEPEIGEPTEQNIPSSTSLGTGLLADRAPQPAAPAAPTPVGGDVKPARLISSVPPTYPPIARNQRIAGDVRVDALIDAQGRVSSMRVVSGPTQLQQAAMDALRQWKYQPATLNGSPVPMHLTVTLQFHLR